jgi:HlyD family secretion protein
MPGVQKPPERRVSRRLPWVVGIVVAIAVLAGLTVWFYSTRRTPPGERYVVTDVRRADLFPTLTASGRVESAKKTVIECKLENIVVGVRGQRLAAGGASVLLSVIPEGSFVKRGDVLAVLDASDYDELLRVQKISVERAVSDKLQAELDLQVARLALREFEEGSMRETIEGYEGTILLSRSDLERASDRLAWSHRMYDKGYIAAGTLATEKYRHAQLSLTLTQQESAYALFKKYTAPKTIKVLRGNVSSAENVVDYQEARLRRHRQRLAMLEEQVKNCTIRAPHDGFVIYATNYNREVAIEEGMTVRQHQQLFYLPDLNDMEVVTMLHESIVEQVIPSMRAHVQVEALRNRQIEGHVTSIAPISLSNWRTDVKYFEGIVKLENIPSGLKPGMTAEVELAMPRRENVLAIPSEAIRIENGRDICFVVHDDGLERREVHLGQTTRELTEVTQGLTEGEQVVVNALNADLVNDAAPGHGEAPAAEPATSPSLTGAVAASR